MNPPVELQQIDALNSVTLNPIVDTLAKTVFTDNLTSGLRETANNFWLLLPDYFVSLMLRLFSFSFILSLILIIFVIWTANKLMKTRKQMHDALLLPNKAVVAKSTSLPPVVNEKWEKVLVHINSSNPSDWKLAILECDIMLADILEKMGYMQESIGEKLKAVEPSDFTNIEAAWEAHKIRNAIAHEGSDFMINEREAKRVIGLYELVFREFEYI
jgi:hypothetical protein